MGQYPENRGRDTCAERPVTGGAGTAVSRRALLCGAVAAPLCLLAAGADAGTAAPWPLTARTIHSGHSLTDPIVPMLDAMVAAIGGGAARARVIDRSTIPGSPMDWRWDHRNQHMPDARHDIADYELLVITERVSLSGTMPWHRSDEVALRWFVHAWENGNHGEGAASILYASWVNTDSGPEYENPHNDPEGHLPFRARLPREMARWQAIIDHVNSHRPAGSPAMPMIPGPLIMAAAHDAIAAGQAPGLARIEDLFSDAIHVNDAGAYLIALAHLAVIYGIDPRTLPARLGRRAVPAPETAAWMKRLVHEVLRDYPDARYAGG